MPKALFDLAPSSEVFRARWIPDLGYASPRMTAGTGPALGCS